MHVRPVFRKWLRIILPLLVVVFGSMLWGDIEYRRYRAVVDRLESRIPQPSATLPEEDGTRFYAAAAMLAVDSQSMSAQQIAAAVRDALVSRQALDASSARTAADTLSANQQTLILVDRAATMKVGQVRERYAVLRSVPVWMMVAPVMSLRTLQQIERGDGDAAAASLVTALRVVRGASIDPQSFAATQRAYALRGLVADLGVLLQRSMPSDEALQAIDTALDTVFAPGDLERLIGGQARFRYANASMYASVGFYDDVIRPMRYRVARAIAESASEAIDVAALPWPDRTRKMAALKSWNVWLAPQALRMISGDANRLVFQSLTESYATGVATARVGRTAIALERARRVSGMWPATLADLHLPGDEWMDPFTGQPMIYRRDGDGYLLYSAGRDGKDDGGQIGPANKAAVPGALGPDVGLRIAAPPR